jgi:hypothetical protein
MAGYNVQSAMGTKHHLIVAHEVINVGPDRARAAIGSEAIEACAKYRSRSFFGHI